MIIGWFYFGCIFWAIGYFQTIFCGYPGSNVRLIKVPKLVYFLFGKPKMANIPKYYVAKGGAGFQIWAFTLLIYGFLIKPLFILPNEIHAVIGFIIGFIISMIIVSLLSKNN